MQSKKFGSPVEVFVVEFADGIKELGEYKVNWTAIVGLGTALFVSVGFWAAVINTTAELVKR